MSERKTKTYKEGNTSYRFDFDSFDEYFMNFCRGNRITRGEAEVRIGEAVGVTEHSVHSWRNRINAPIDIEVARKLASVLDAKDESRFLIVEKEGKIMENLNERQICAVKRVFDSIVDSLYNAKLNHRYYDVECEAKLREEYPEWDGDCDTVQDLFGMDGMDFEEAWHQYQFNCIHLEIEKVRCVISKEYFDLHNTVVYDEFSAFCENELFGVYFFNGDPDFYCKAIRKLHTIVGIECDSSVIERQAEVVVSPNTDYSNENITIDLDAIPF